MGLLTKSRIPLPAYKFNATTSDINLGAHPAQDVLVQTVMMFCYPTGIGENGTNYMMSLCPSAGFAGMRFIHLDNTGNPQFGLQMNSATAGTPVHNSNSNSAPYNNWYHVAGTYDGSINSSGIQVYIGKNFAPMTNQTTNGANNVEGSGSAVITGGYNLHIGNREGTDRTTNGMIVWAARWNRILSLDEMLVAQTKGPLYVPGGLILFWANGRDYGPGLTRPVSTTDLAYGIAPPGLSQLLIPRSAFVGMAGAGGGGIITTTVAARAKARSADTTAKTGTAALASRGKGRVVLSAGPLVLQKMRPTSDIAANGWLPSTGVYLYAVIDEAVVDDADYAYSPSNPSTQVMEVKFGAGSVPVVGTRTLRYRLQAINQDTFFTVDLVQGTTVVQSWTQTVTVAAGPTTFSQTISGTITDYSDLRMRVTASP